MTFSPSIAAVIDAPFDAIAIDMPIGLPDSAQRSAEIEARRYLSPRGSTIFPTPARACLAAVDYADACALSMRASGVKISQQSWHILPKIAELDAAIDAGDSHRIAEAHPECSFTMMNGGRPLEPKRSAAGLARRTQLVIAAFGVVPAVVRPGRLDDVLDAYSMLWTAERFARGDHLSFPNGHSSADGHSFPDRDGRLDEHDSRGLPMRIVR